MIPNREIPCQCKFEISVLVSFYNYGIYSLRLSVTIGNNLFAQLELGKGGVDHETDRHHTNRRLDGD